MGRIHEQICAMIQQCEHIGKEKKSQQGYQYRGIDDVYNVVHPLLATNKVFSTSEVLDSVREERTTKQGGVIFYTRLKMKYTFWADDGTSISTEVIGEGMDSADKGTNKAMSIAYKYALFQMLCIPTEAIDPDADKKPELEPTTETKEAATQSRTAPQQERKRQEPTGDAAKQAARFNDLAGKIAAAQCESELLKINGDLIQARAENGIKESQYNALEKMMERRISAINEPVPA